MYGRPRKAKKAAQHSNRDSGNDDDDDADELITDIQLPTYIRRTSSLLNTVLEKPPDTLQQSQTAKDDEFKTAKDGTDSKSKDGSLEKSRGLFTRPTISRDDPTADGNDVDTHVPLTRARRWSFDDAITAARKEDLKEARKEAEKDMQKNKGVVATARNSRQAARLAQEVAIARHFKYRQLIKLLSDVNDMLNTEMAKNPEVKMALSDPVYGDMHILGPIGRLIRLLKRQQRLETERIQANRKTHKKEYAQQNDADYETEDVSERKENDGDKVKRDNSDRIAGDKAKGNNVRVDEADKGSTPTGTTGGKAGGMAGELVFQSEAERHDSAARAAGVAAIFPERMVASLAGSMASNRASRPAYRTVQHAADAPSSRQLTEDDLAQDMRDALVQAPATPLFVERPPTPYPDASPSHSFLGAAFVEGGFSAAQRKSEAKAQALDISGGQARVQTVLAIPSHTSLPTGVSRHMPGLGLNSIDEVSEISDTASDTNTLAMIMPRPTASVIYKPPGIIRTNRDEWIENHIRHLQETLERRVATEAEKLAVRTEERDAAAIAAQDAVLERDFYIWNYEKVAAQNRKLSAFFRWLGTEARGTSWGRNMRSAATGMGIDIWEKMHEGEQESEAGLEKGGAGENNAGWAVMDDDGVQKPIDKGKSKAPDETEAQQLEQSTANDSGRNGHDSDVNEHGNNVNIYGSSIYDDGSRTSTHGIPVNTRGSPITGSNTVGRYGNTKDVQNSPLYSDPYDWPPRGCSPKIYRIPMPSSHWPNQWSRTPSTGGSSLDRSPPVASRWPKPTLKRPLWGIPSQREAPRCTCSHYCTPLQVTFLPPKILESVDGPGSQKHPASPEDPASQESPERPESSPLVEQPKQSKPSPSPLMKPPPTALARLIPRLLFWAWSNPPPQPLLQPPSPINYTGLGIMHAEPSPPPPPDTGFWATVAHIALTLLQLVLQQKDNATEIAAWVHYTYFRPLLATYLNAAAVFVRALANPLEHDELPFFHASRLARAFGNVGNTGDPEDSKNPGSAVHISNPFPRDAAAHLLAFLPIPVSLFVLAAAIAERNLWLDHNADFPRTYMHSYILQHHYDTDSCSAHLPSYHNYYNHVLAPVGRWAASALPPSAASPPAVLSPYYWCACIPTLVDPRILTIPVADKYDVFLAWLKDLARLAQLYTSPIQFDVLRFPLSQTFILIVDILCGLTLADTFSKYILGASRRQPAEQEPGLQGK